VHGDQGSSCAPGRGDEGLARGRTSHWVAEATGATVGAATRTLETARALEQLPETDAAFRAGRLSDVQAAEITSTAIADPGAEGDLLAAAGSTSVKGLRDRCREVRAGAEPDDRAWARRLHSNRWAHEWTDPDGTYRLDARLAPDAGARFSSAWKGAHRSGLLPGAPCRPARAPRRVRGRRARRPGIRRAVQAG
jgi:hypothetical protein